MSDINSKEYLEKVIENAPEGATHFDNSVSYYKSNGMNNSWGIWKGAWCICVGCNTMRMPPLMRQIKDAKSQLDMIYDLEKLQAENAELKKQNSELFRLKEVFKARNHKALDYLYEEGCDSAYDARCALEGE